MSETDERTATSELENMDKNAQKELIEIKGNFHITTEIRDPVKHK